MADQICRDFQGTQKFGLKLLLVKEFWSLPVEHSVDPTTLRASTQLWMHFHAENPFVKHILPALPEINTKLRQTKAFLISPGLKCCKKLSTTDCSSRRSAKNEAAMNFSLRVFTLILGFMTPTYYRWAVSFTDKQIVTLSPVYNNGSTEPLESWEGNTLSVWTICLSSFHCSTKKFSVKYGPEWTWVCSHMKCDLFLWVEKPIKFLQQISSSNLFLILKKPSNQRFFSLCFVSSVWCSSC